MSADCKLPVANLRWGSQNNSVLNVDHDGLIGLWRAAAVPRVGLHHIIASLERAPQCGATIPKSAARSIRSCREAAMTRSKRRRTARVSSRLIEVPRRAFLAAGLLIVCHSSTLPAADRALGAYLAGECVTCHQTTERHAGIPPIVGLPEAAFAEILAEYRLGKRENPVMRTIAARLSSEEIAALAAYFGSVPR
jgi:cytochrome c